MRSGDRRKQAVQSNDRAGADPRDGASRDSPWANGAALLRTAAERRMLSVKKSSTPRQSSRPCRCRRASRCFKAHTSRRVLPRRSGREAAPPALHAACLRRAALSPPPPAPDRHTTDWLAPAGSRGWRVCRAGHSVPARRSGPGGTRWLEPGESVDDEAALAGYGPTATLTRMRRTSLGTRRGGLRLFRVWDAASDGIRSFDAIETFPFDAAWVLEACVEPVDDARTIPFEHLRDNGATRDLVVPGDITFSLVDDGRARVHGRRVRRRRHAARPVRRPDLPSRRPGAESYPVGRFLVVQRLGGAADAGTPGPVLLDFNRAYSRRAGSRRTTTARCRPRRTASASR